MSLIQKVKIASVPNGTRTIRAIGSAPKRATPIMIKITSHDIATHNAESIKSNICTSVHVYWLTH